MRFTVIAFSLAVATVTPGGMPAAAENVRCTAIRDSAMCISEPTCWFDAAGGKGCLEGPAPKTDGCAAHGSESICNNSSLGCAWDAAANKCAGKTE